MTLSSAVDWASDLRWLDEDRLLLTSSKSGIQEITISDPEVPRMILPAGTRQSLAWAPHVLARSDTHVAYGSIAFSASWFPRQESFEPGRSQEYFEVPADLDLLGRKLAVLGPRKAEAGGYEANGAFVWQGSVSVDGLDELRPIAFASDGGTATAINKCLNFHFGSLRYLGDGSLVVVPFSEPGVFLFGPEGGLERTWSSEALDLHGGCPLSAEEELQAGVSPTFRQDWLNARRIVDEIIPLGGRRFGLLVREVRDGSTGWSMVRMHPDGQFDTCSLGVVADETWSHFKADVLGRRVALLQSPNFRTNDPAEKPEHPPLVYLTTLDSTTLVSED